MNKSGDLDFEIRFYEGVLEKKHDFIEALTALGDLYTRKGSFEQGLAIDQRLFQLRPEDPLVLYNLACSYSLLHQTDQAYETIKKAIRCGYDDFDYLRRDKDLADLLAEQRFQDFLAETEKNRA